MMREKSTSCHQILERFVFYLFLISMDVISVSKSRNIYQFIMHIYNQCSKRRIAFFLFNTTKVGYLQEPVPYSCFSSSSKVTSTIRSITISTFDP